MRPDGLAAVRARFLFGDGAVKAYKLAGGYAEADAPGEVQQAGQLLAVLHEPLSGDRQVAAQQHQGGLRRMLTAIR